MKRFIIKKNIPASAGLIVLVFLTLIAVFAPYAAPYDPLQQNLYEGLNPPSLKHLLGQDRLGRDLLSRLIFGARISLFVGSVTVLVSSLAGIAIGSISGYVGGITDSIIMRICDIFLAFPGILFAITLMAVFGPSLQNVVFALCIFGWVGYARLVRAQVLTLRETDYVAAARAQGTCDARILISHIIPNLIAPVIVEVTFGMAGAILAEAGLSFLGLGTQPPTPSWGTILNEGRRYMLISPHLTIFPGCAIMIVVLGLNLLGDGLRDYFDPHIS